MCIDQYAVDQYAGRLEQIRRRLAATTPGPWSRHGADVHAAGREVLFTGRDGSARIRSQADADAEFVAHAHADVAVLLHLITHRVLVNPDGNCRGAAAHDAAAGWAPAGLASTEMALASPRPGVDLAIALADAYEANESGGKDCILDLTAEPGLD